MPDGQRQIALERMLQKLGEKDMLLDDMTQQAQLYANHLQQVMADNDRLKALLTEAGLDPGAQPRDEAAPTGAPPVRDAEPTPLRRPRAPRPKHSKPKQEQPEQEVVNA